MDKEGNFLDDTDDETTQEEIEIENECKELVTDTDLCEKAYNYSACFTEKRKERQNKS